MFLDQAYTPKKAGGNQLTHPHPSPYTQALKSRKLITVVSMTNNASSFILTKSLFNASLKLFIIKGTQNWIFQMGVKKN